MTTTAQAGRTFYVEASFTLPPAAVAWAVENQNITDEVILHEDDGGGVIASVVTQPSPTLAYALSAAIVAAKDALVEATRLEGRADAIDDPWRVTIIDSVRMIRHYSGSVDEQPESGPDGLVGV